jgi:hypothetical protein
MARTVASLPAGSRISDSISLGVIAKFFPLERVRAVLAETGRASIRERDLPAHVVVSYVIALALYMRSSTREVLRCLLEGVQWLLDLSRSTISLDTDLRQKEWDMPNTSPSISGSASATWRAPGRPPRDGRTGGLVS